jgi:acetyl-CoA carboxylase carboxyltransferase component
MVKREDPKAGASAAEEEPHGGLAREFERRRANALAMGGTERLARRRATGMLDARERLDKLLDPGSFIESGLFGTSSSRPEDRDRTPPTASWPASAASIAAMSRSSPTTSR